MANELPSRNEVKIEDTWRLEDLYATKEDWENDLKKIRELTDEVVVYEGKVGASADNLFTVLDKSIQIDQLLSKVFNYAERLYDQDTTNNESQAGQAKAFSVYSQVSSAMAFEDPEILEIDEETLEQFYSEKKELELYRNYIKEVQRLKNHRLPAEMEKIISLTAEMSRTSEETYGILENADLVFPEMKDEKGETVRLTHGRFIPMLECSDRAVRKEAFEKYYSVYKQFLNTFASLYNGQIQQQIFYAKVRKYESTLEAAVDANNVSGICYRNLVETVNRNLDKMHRYVGLRKKALGVDELHMYDIYTPMVSGVARKYTFEEAKEICLKALEPLGEEYVSVIREGFANRWIDVYENKGKRSGAYEACAYGTHPYVLLNFNGSLDNVFTLIHEMGHAMHSYFSNKKQPYVYSQYRIFVAEVASTCNELLLLEYLLKNTSDPGEKMYLLNHYLDMFKGTLFRQTQFAEFEMKTNAMVEAGEAVNATNLCDLYKEINERYYGPEMISDEEISYEWARIPHFYYNFYVYQYATSMSASVAISHAILTQGAPKVEGYLEFLSGGCSDSPVNLLRKVGVDLESCEPIQSALDVMDGVLDEMEKMLEQN